MLCASLQNFRDKVVARQVEKSDGPFFCPKCRSELVLRKGQIKTHHFAHKPPVTCKFGVGESEAHEKVKESLYFALSDRPDVSECEMEKDWGSVVSDIYVVIRGARIAFEVQLSNLSIEEIAFRTQAYCSLGVAVLWLPLFSEKLEKKRYSPRAWEKWLHAAGYQRVYYWLSGLTLIPVHFGKYWLEEDDAEWYDQWGGYQSREGVVKGSKRWITPVLGEPVNLARDMIIQRRTDRKVGKLEIPRSMLLVGREEKWW